MAGEAERTILEVATRHHGACTRADLLAAGLTRSTIDRRIRTGLLRKVGSGIYMIAGRRDDPDALAAAALLAAPEGALSHWTAAQLHAFALPHDTALHLVVPHGTQRPQFAVVHESRHLPAADVVVLRELRVTSSARTIVDLAGFLRPARLAHLIERQLVRGEPTAADLLACHRALARRGRSGSGRLRQVLAEILDDEPFPESELELAMARLLQDGGFEGFRRQYRPPWFDGTRGVVDFARPDVRLLIEVDGRRWHSTSQAFLDDRRRDRVALAHGWRVLRFGWQEVFLRSDEVRSELDRHLALGQRTGSED